jgi:diguanylate cyclase (GGDEF)-like protein
MNLAFTGATTSGMRNMIQQIASQTTKTTRKTNLMGVRPDPAVQPAINPAVKGIELLQKLQTSLDIEQIIDLFSSNILDMIPHEGYLFELEELAISFLQGRQSRHKISYNLTINEEVLGTLTLFRNWKFKENEIKQLESVLPHLLHPLRNGLQYFQAVQFAYKDRLTGLHNRAALDMEAPHSIELAHRNGMELSMMMIDIDHFKNINDTYGHLCGDKILQKVGQIVRDTIRGSDLAFRYGGEEIAVLLPSADREGSRRLAERLRENIKEMGYCDQSGLTVTVSIGISTLIADDVTETLFTRADQALYEAKRNGRDQVCMG